MRPTRAQFVALLVSLSSVVPVAGQNATTTAPSPPSNAAREVDAHYRAGLGLLERGMHDLAVPELTAFLEAAPDSPDAPSARYALAVCYVKIGRGADATRELDRVISVPNFTFAADALLLRAQCELDAGHAAKALGFLDRLSKDFAARAAEEPATALRVEALVAAERVAESRDALKSALDRFPQSTSHERFVYLLGRAHAASGDDRGAVETLAALRSTRGPYQAHAALLEARSRIALDDAGGALEALRAVAQPPRELGDSFAYWLAVSERRTGADAAAAARLKDAIAAFPSSPLVPDMLIERATALSKLGDHAAAERDFATLLERHPDASAFARAAIGRGLALARLGRDDEARSALEAALAARPDLAPELRDAAEDELVELAASANDWPAVERHASDLLARRAKGSAPAADERATELLLRLGVAQLKQSNPEARTPLEAALARSAKNPAVHQAALRGLLALARRDGRTDDAKRLLLELSDSSPDALFELAGAQWSDGDIAAAAASYERFARAHGDDARAVEARARRALAEARLGHAKEFIAASDELSAQLSALDPALRSSLRFERAVALASIGREDDSARELEVIAGDDGASAWHAHALLELARRSFESGSDAQALPFLARAASAVSAAPPAERDAIEERILYMTGAAHFRAGATAEAARELAAFVERCPKSQLRPSALLLLAQASLALKRGDDAIAPLMALLSIDPAPDLLEPALLGLGEAHATARHWTDSEAAYAQLMERFPTSPRTAQARFGIAWAREQRGERDSALETYATVANSGATELAARAQFQRGVCLAALKRNDEAVREFLKVDVLFQSPTWASAALYEAGRCLATLGRGDDARRQFDEVITRFGDSEWAAAARRERDRLAAATSEPTRIP